MQCCLFHPDFLYAVIALEATKHAMHWIVVTFVLDESILQCMKVKDACKVLEGPLLVRWRRHGSAGVEMRTERGTLHGTKAQDAWTSDKGNTIQSFGRTWHLSLLVRGDKIVHQHGDVVERACRIGTVKVHLKVRFGLSLTRDSAHDFWLNPFVLSAKILFFLRPIRRPAREWLNKDLLHFWFAALGGPKHANLLALFLVMIAKILLRNVRKVLWFDG